VGAIVELDRLPISKELMEVSREYGWDRYEMAVSGGEDFELLFTAEDGVEKLIDIPVYPIGKIVQEKELIWTIDNKPMNLDFMGYNHF
jgi:thiamine-monophosphate kinase